MYPLQWTWEIEERRRGAAQDPPRTPRRLVECEAGCGVSVSRRGKRKPPARSAMRSACARREQTRHAIYTGLRRTRLASLSKRRETYPDLVVHGERALCFQGVSRGARTSPPNPSPTRRGAFGLPPGRASAGGERWEGCSPLASNPELGSPSLGERVAAKPWFGFRVPEPGRGQGERFRLPARVSVKTDSPSPRGRGGRR